MYEGADHMPGLMAERDGYNHGVPCAVDTMQPDPEAAVGFYGDLFGWEFEDVMPPESERSISSHGSAAWTWLRSVRSPGADRRRRCGTRTCWVDDDQSDMPTHWSVIFATDDADATATKASELGGQVIVPPFDAPWVRMTVIADPQGATFIASQFVPENKDVGS